MRLRRDAIGVGHLGALCMLLTGAFACATTPPRNPQRQRGQVHAPARRITIATERSRIHMDAGLEQHGVLDVPASVEYVQHAWIARARDLRVRGEPFIQLALAHEQAWEIGLARRVQLAQAPPPAEWFLVATQPPSTLPAGSELPPRVELTAECAEPEAAEFCVLAAYAEARLLQSADVECMHTAESAEYTHLLALLLAHRVLPRARAPLLMAPMAAHERALIAASSHLGATCTILELRNAVAEAEGTAACVAR